MYECLNLFSGPTRAWFKHAFDVPTAAQSQAWPVIHAGGNALVVAPTGSGKTSLVNLIPRFSDVSGGTLTIDGTPVGRYDLQGLRHAIGIATQDVFLFSRYGGRQYRLWRLFPLRG